MGLNTYDLKESKESVTSLHHNNSLSPPFGAKHHRGHVADVQTMRQSAKIKQRQVSLANDQ